jgi:citrate synthase
MTTKLTGKAGLEDVVVASSSICFIDGEQGILSYAGHDIHELVRSATYEEVCFLLWNRRLPTRSELGDLQSIFASARRLPEGILRLLRTLPSGNAMDAVRTLVSGLAHYDLEVVDCSPLASYRSAVRLTGQVSSLVATYGRMKTGGGAIDPDPALGHAANFLLMLKGERPTELETRAFDTALVLHADHELNASTFAARVTAATLSDVHSAVVAGIGALKGPLHGGANAEVMRILQEIGEDATAARIDKFVQDMLSRKVKVPGFGHRVYRTEDPRATHLREMSRQLGENSGNTHWFEMSQRIEAVMERETKIAANVDFYSASVYHTLGISVELFTPIFAVSRVAGWTAHVLEQYANNRLIRPRAEYTGPEYPQLVTSLDER